MQKIISGTSVKKLDELYIKRHGITSHQLMERAAKAFVDWFIQMFDGIKNVYVLSGIGNNGGDGLAIARMLAEKGVKVSVYVVGEADNGSADFKQNFHALPNTVTLKQVVDVKDVVLGEGVLIDGVFGVGINRPVSGLALEVAVRANTFTGEKIAIDLPSGLPSDGVLDSQAVKVDYTVTFQFPKLALLFPEHADYTGEMIVLSIGMDDSDFDSFDSDRFFLRRTDVPQLHRRFHRFSHKGDYGKILLAGGSSGKMGSIALSAKAAMRTGSGMVTTFVPDCGRPILQTLIPEVMVETSTAYDRLSLSLTLGTYDALGVGPGMGQSGEAVEALDYLMREFDGPMVIDADAINIISKRRDLLGLLKNKVLTPHLKEFERLVGKCSNHLDRMEKSRAFAKDHGCAVVLKGAFSLISFPDGRQIFNSSGNQHMATAGSGDVLVGIITSFLGQGYALENAVLCGVYHHGLAGEIASSQKLRGTIASDIIEALPETFRVLGIRT